MSTTTDQIDPAKSPLYIGAGIEIEGTIKHVGAQDERAVVLGTFKGNIECNGVLQVIEGAKVIITESCKAREMVVAGEIVGATPDVVIQTGLIKLGQSAVVDVGTLEVPPGGLEQDRGSVVNARLRMTGDHPYGHPAQPAQRAGLTVISPETSTRPVPTLTTEAGAQPQVRHA